jgi:hypothetical protein
MVARNSSAVRIEKCDGHGLCGFTATRKKKHRQQNSRYAQMSKAMRCKRTLIGAAHHTTHGFRFGWIAEAVFTAFATFRNKR